MNILALLKAALVGATLALAATSCGGGNGNMGSNGQPMAAAQAGASSPASVQAHFFS
jgi:F0F1-type ATP synthase membrane subunit c/vacuolar-type H+-ATPase subunit K